MDAGGCGHPSPTCIPCEGCILVDDHTVVSHPNDSNVDGIWTGRTPRLGGDVEFHAYVELTPEKERDRRLLEEVREGHLLAEVRDGWVRPVGCNIRPTLTDGSRGDDGKSNSHHHHPPRSL